MKNKILFICTGNIFRSLSAEYILKKYLFDNKIFGYQVSSAGTIAKEEPVDKKVKSTLEKLGIKEIKHKQRKLTKDILDENDVIIAMAKNHYDYIKNNFSSKNVFYFNELAKNEKSSMWDIGDVIKNPKENRQLVEDQIEKTINYINKNIPALFKKLKIPQTL